ncbi:AraC family transcriptional regulator [Treponema parvum]|uniref:AraC family transcriptional regulator n=1 Tax=Treponema parvum TaxID=138851 RepID=UPI001AEBDF9E|nr:AraC family transcriptional regulator [Treponema parvum]QTQ17242.1 helix-turn-helix transcriptional regulator [Treponema parvum]
MIYKDDRIIFWALYDDPQEHKHFAKHVLISSMPFICTVEETSENLRSLVIQSNVMHRIRRNKDAPMAVFLIDTTSELSRIIDDELLKGKKFGALPSEIENHLIRMLDGRDPLEAVDEYLVGTLVERTERKSLKAMSVSGSLCKQRGQRMDSRIAEAICLMEQCESIESDAYDTFPRTLCLSKSRFLHLFKEEVGIDFKNYLLLKKLEKTCRCVVEKGMSITDAAIRAGFSSSSHFATVCKKYCGISFTDFLKSGS